jgi:hypothetical protein
MKALVRAVCRGGKLALVGLLFLPAASAQEKTRAAEIEAARDKKTEELKPEEVSKVEDRLRKIKDDKIIERFSAGLYGVRAMLGGAGTGQGFAIGPEWARRDLFTGRATLLANYQITTTASTRGEIRFRFPSGGGTSSLLAAPSARRSKHFFEIGMGRHNYNRVSYYGPGPESEKEGHSNYRYEDITFDTQYLHNLTGNFYVGPSFGYLKVNVGPGKNDDVISTDKQFTPEQTPGIQKQTDFLRYGGIAGFDWRDVLGGARAGGVYAANYNYYQDRSLNRHDHHSLKARAEQYIPFYNKRRVIALRALADFTWTRHDQVVPFYLQPVLGGSEDLRGYRPYRFYGDNSLVMNAEYRWEIWAGTDAAIFADAGKVFNDKGQFNFKNLESSVGFGLRFNVRNAVFLRTDIGFSHEGFQVWIKFGDVFMKKPIGRSSPEHIF